MRRAAPGRGVGPGPLAPTPITGFLGESRTVTFNRYSADRGCKCRSVADPAVQAGQRWWKDPRVGRAVGPGAGCAGSPSLQAGASDSSMTTRPCSRRSWTRTRVSGRPSSSRTDACSTQARLRARRPNGRSKRQSRASAGSSRPPDGDGSARTTVAWVSSSATCAGCSARPVPADHSVATASASRWRGCWLSSWPSARVGRSVWLRSSRTSSYLRCCFVLGL